MSRFILILALAFGLSWSAAAGAEPHRAFPREAEVSGVVNLNTASDTELRVLPGIGPAKAQRILAQRAKHKFESTDQLMRVKGIGRKTYRKLKPYLAIAGPTTIARKKAPRRDEAEAEPRADRLPDIPVPPNGG